MQRIYLWSITLVCLLPLVVVGAPAESPHQLRIVPIYRVFDPLPAEFDRVRLLSQFLDGAIIYVDNEETYASTKVDDINHNLIREKRNEIRRKSDEILHRRRGKRSIGLFTGFLSSSSAAKNGGAGDANNGDRGSGSESGGLLNLLGPLLGSSSGGGGGEGGDGGGSDLGAILQLVGPLLGSSSGGSESGDANSPNGNSENGGGSASILNLFTSLLGSSSRDQGADGSNEEGGGGSDFSSILNLSSSSLGGGSDASSSGNTPATRKRSPASIATKSASAKRSPNTGTALESPEREPANERKLEA